MFIFARIKNKFVVSEGSNLGPLLFLLFMNDLKLAAFVCKIMSFILCNCGQLDNVSVLKVQFSSPVRFKLKYCALLWNLLYVTYKLRIGNLQRSF